MTLSLRTPEMEEKYQIYKKSVFNKCCFCRELKSDFTAIKKRFNYWAIMKNDFPYDALYKEHDLLFPLRHAEFGDLTVKEVEEYNRICKLEMPNYHQKIENLGERISQKGNFHIHLLKFID